MPQTLPLTEKYRPSKIEDFVLPRRHSLDKALEFLPNPYSAAFLLTGPPGLGKTSLARLMGQAAVTSEFAYQEWVGPDLEAGRVAQLASTIQGPPLGGGMWAIVINEADAIPRVGQIRLLALLEGMRHAVVVATANADFDSYESRLTSRFTVQRFSREGLLEPATAWLEGIAAKECISVTRKSVQRMIVESKSNMRAALQALDAYAARPAARMPAPLPVTSIVMEPASNRPRITSERSI